MTPLPPPTAGVTLRTLVRVLNQAFVHVVTAPHGDDVAISSVVLVDADDLADTAFAAAGGADLWLLAGVPVPVATAWLARLAASPTGAGPRAVMSKLGTAPELEAAARGAGTALVAVHPQARWESLLWTVRGVLDHLEAHGFPPATEERLTEENLVFALPPELRRDLRRNALND